MTDSPDERSETRRVYIPGGIDRPEGARSWSNWIIPAIISAAIGLGVTLSLTLGGKVITGGETSAVLEAKMSALTDDIKEMKKLQQDLLLKAADLYTRREAQADREAAERRFQSLEGRIGDLNRRLETLETNQRFMQNTIMDRTPAPSTITRPR